MKDREFLSTREVAERLRVVPRTIRTWLKNGLLRGLRSSRRTIRLRWSDVHDKLREGERSRARKESA